MEVRRIEQALALGRLGWAYILGMNLMQAGALCYSHVLGMRACTCDRGPAGYEWYPGCGTTPEAIENREWNDDEHDFEPGDVKAPADRLYVDKEGPFCVECGRREEAWVHKHSGVRYDD